MTIDEPKRERVKKGEQNSRETLQKPARVPNFCVHGKDEKERGEADPCGRDWSWVSHPGTGPGYLGHGPGKLIA